MKHLGVDILDLIRKHAVTIRVPTSALNEHELLDYCYRKSCCYRKRVQSDLRFPALCGFFPHGFEFDEFVISTCLNNWSCHCVVESLRIYEQNISSFSPIVQLSTDCKSQRVCRARKTHTCPGMCGEASPLPAVLTQVWSGEAFDLRLTCALYWKLIWWAAQNGGRGLGPCHGCLAWSLA